MKYTIFLAAFVFVMLLQLASSECIDDVHLGLQADAFQFSPSINPFGKYYKVSKEKMIYHGLIILTMHFIRNGGFSPFPIPLRM